MLLVASVGDRRSSPSCWSARPRRWPSTCGWNHIFVGVILLAIIGNAAEHSTAILLARRNDMDTAMTITYQSQPADRAVRHAVARAAQRAHGGGCSVGQASTLDLVFHADGSGGRRADRGDRGRVDERRQTNWFEGVLLLALYAILGIAFFYIPTSSSAALESFGRSYAQG